MQFKKATIIIVVAFLVIAGGLFYIFDTQFSYPEEYLIEGVPYWGAYVGSRLDSSGTAALYSVLQYWGDERSSTKDIVREVGGKAVTYGTITDFATSQGYTVRTKGITTLEGLFPIIKRDTPILISQRTSLDAPPFLSTIRILIGYSIPDQKLIFHDYLFGNNYKISFNDFEELWVGQAKEALILKPGRAIRQILLRSDVSEEYPERLALMESPEIQDIFIRWAIISELQREGAVAREVAQLWEEVVRHPEFANLHPASQVKASYSLAKLYVDELDEFQKAITLLTRITLPLLDLDLNRSVGEWEIREPEVYDSAWYSLPRALLKEARTQ